MQIFIKERLTGKTKNVLFYKNHLANKKANRKEERQEIYLCSGASLATTQLIYFQTQ